MEIVVTARHTELSDRFRRHCEEKLSKVEQLNPRIQKLHVRVSHEANPRQTNQSERIEVTVHAKGPVIRAEASAEDRYGALDLAVDKLAERLRRAKERRQVSYRRGESLKGKDHIDPDPVMLEPVVPEQAGSPEEGGVEATGDSPIVIREKKHADVPMTLDDALNQMELVGHDFYLFNDKETDSPSVVYRRRGWSYGVIRLVQEEVEQA